MSTDRQSIESSLRTMFKDGDRIMLAVLRLIKGKESMQHEFFSTIADAVAATVGFDADPDVVGIYTTAQQLKQDATSNTKNDVAAYVRFIVDVDRKNKKVTLLDSDGQSLTDQKCGKPKMRPTNATEDERADLLSAVNQIVPWTSGILGAKPMICDSGNGFHLVWFLSVPCKVDKAGETQRTIQECILAIKQRFEKGNVDIDVSVADPGQLIRLWGTWNRKAIQEKGRPWRQSKILARASGTVLPSALDMLACEYAAPKPIPTKTYDKNAERTNPDWLEDYGIPDWCDFAGEFAPLIDTYEKNDETHYKLANCVFDTEDGLHVHQNGKNQRQTEIILYPDGGIGFSCLGSDDWFHATFPDKPKPSFSDLIRRVNELKSEKYPHLIFPEADRGIGVEDLTDFGVEIDGTDPRSEESVNDSQTEPKQDAKPHPGKTSQPHPDLKLSEWTAAMFAAIFRDPQGVYGDFRIWRSRLDWIVRKKALPKDELPAFALLLEYENAKKRLPSRDELTLYKPELIGKVSIPALEGDFSFDYCVDKVLERAEKLDEVRTATTYLEGLKAGKSRDEMRRKVRASWSNSISVDVARAEGSIQDKADEIYERFRRYTEGETAMHTFTTPFDVVNRTIDMDAERLFAVIAPSSHFKTSVLLSVAHDLAEQGKSVLVIAGEQDPANIEDRLTLIHGDRKQYREKLPTYKQIRDGNATPEDLVRLRALCDDWKSMKTIKSPLVVKGLAEFNNDFDKIVAWMEETDRKYQWGALIIDPFEELTVNFNPKELFFGGNKICQKMLGLKTNYMNGRGLIVATSFQLKKAVGKKLREIKDDGTAFDEIKAYDYEAALDRNEIETFSGAAKKFDMLWGVANTSEDGRTGILTCARTRYGKPFPATYFQVGEKSHYCHQTPKRDEASKSPTGLERPAPKEERDAERDAEKRKSRQEVKNQERHEKRVVDSGQLEEAI